jgi:TIR domain
MVYRSVERSTCYDSKTTCVQHRCFSLRIRSLLTNIAMQGKIHSTKHFLRGVGFTETQIEYIPSLLTPRPIQYHSLFISYAHQDQAIAERLYNDFRKNDIPCWFDRHELIPGDYYRHKIDEAIRTHDKLVLILSQHSIKSKWVEEEVELALKREESMDIAQQVLFPIRLDDTAMTTNRRWISSLRYHRHIGDFTGWQDDAAYNQAFTTLLQHLKITQAPAQ